MNKLEDTVFSLSLSFWTQKYGSWQLPNDRQFVKTYSDLSSFELMIYILNLTSLPLINRN